MAKKFLRVFLICLLIFLGSSLLLCSASGDSPLFSYDDRSDYLTYSARTATVTSVGYNGTASRISRGNTVIFDFYGDSLSLYCVKYTNSGRARVYIDGVAVGYTVSGVTSDYSSALAFTYSGLGSGKHSVSIEAWDQTVSNPAGQSVTAYFYLDYIEVPKDLDVEGFSRFLLITFVSLFFTIYLVQFVIKFVLWRLYPDD